MAISGDDYWANPVHDAAGNMTAIPAPLSPSVPLLLTFDAWNRLVEAKLGMTVVQANQYDGLNRRIVRTNASETRHFYYNNQWQVLEERVGTSTAADKQYVYHPHYVDAIAMRYDANDDEHYFLQDANFNVTAVVDETGTVEERYAYTPYGEVTILDADFSADADNESDISNEHLYTGRRLDPETGLQLNRNRFYASHLGRWVNRDPVRYRAGLNLYRYVDSRPTFYVDSDGLIGLADPRDFDVPRIPGDNTVPPGNPNGQGNDDAGLGLELGNAICECGPLGALDAFVNAQAARYWTKSEFSKEKRVQGGPGDAYRHCMWNCLNVASPLLSYDCAVAVADYHEEVNQQNGSPQEHIDMDLHNNAVGRLLGLNCWTGSCCSKACKKALEDGRLKVITPVE